MARLIHLNGPLGVGKSTLAALYADRHPGTLNLDIDLLHRLVGGWREGDGRTHDLLRPLALAMAAAHLAQGREVVLPQFLDNAAELEAFEQVASQAGATFREVILTGPRDEVIARFQRRTTDPEFDAYNRRLVTALGGESFLTARYDRLAEFAGRRTAAAFVAVVAGDVEGSYAALLHALA